MLMLISKGCNRLCLAHVSKLFKADEPIAFPGLSCSGPNSVPLSVDNSMGGIMVAADASLQLPEERTAMLPL